MSQIPSHFDASESDLAETEPAPFSISSVFSLIMGLLVCIPGASVLGLLLGMVGFARTGGGVRRGRAIAVTGILLSLIVTTFWAIGTLSIAPYFRGSFAMFLEGPETVLQATFEGENEVVRKYFLQRCQPTDEEIAVFAEAAKSRFGSFEGVSMSETQTDPDRMDFPIKVRFDSGVVPGRILFSAGDDVELDGDLDDLALTQSAGGLMSVVMMESIVIDIKGEPSIFIGRDPATMSGSDDDPTSDEDEES